MNNQDNLFKWSMFICAILGPGILAGYVANEQGVEMYRWILTSVFTVAGISVTAGNLRKVK